MAELIKEIPKIIDIDSINAHCHLFTGRAVPETRSLCKRIPRREQKPHGLREAHVNGNCTVCGLDACQECDEIYDSGIW